MATATRPASAALKIDWAKVITSLGLKGQTAASLQAFKKRNDDARRKLNQLEAAAQTVDFAAYRAQLQNGAVVDEVERAFNAFKPVTYDVGRQIKAIEAFEAQAIKSAQETKTKVDEQVSDLMRAVQDIRDTRSVDDLTVDDVAKAEPKIDEYTAKLVSKGRWDVPGYKEKFGDLAML